MPTVMPIFPLNTVVFPGQQLPLHIFEPRYLRLVADVMRDEGEFGIALIESGREVGGGAVPREVGCAVRITELQEAPGGRYNVICSGTRRYRIVQSVGGSAVPAGGSGVSAAAHRRRRRGGGGVGVGRGGAVPGPPGARAGDGGRLAAAAADAGGPGAPGRRRGGRHPGAGRAEAGRPGSARGCRPAWRSGCGCWKWRISRCGSNW